MHFATVAICNCVASFSSVSTAEDTALIVAWKEAPSGRVKAQLLSAFLKAKRGLIRKLTFKAAGCERSTLAEDELLHAGSIGFVRAVKGFDPSFGCAISTHAYSWIRKEVQMATHAEKIISLPRIRLTNAERAMAIAAYQEDPDVDPETIGIPRTQFEQVKASYGLRFVSDAVPAGGLAIERCMRERATHVEAEEDLDHRRRLRFMEEMLGRIVRGATQAECCLSDEAYAAALEYIRTEEKAIMTENQAVETPKKKRVWTADQRVKLAAKMAERRAEKAAAAGPQKARRAGATEVHKASPNRFEVRLAQLEAEKKVLELLASLDAEVVTRVIETLKAAA